MYRFINPVHWALSFIKRKYSCKLANKLILFMAGIFIISIVSVTVVSYEIIRSQSISNAVANDTNNVKIVNNDFENYFNEIEKYSFPQGDYEKFANSIASDSFYNSDVYLQNYVGNLYYSRDDIDAIYLYLLAQQKCYYIVRSNVFGGVRTLLNVDTSRLEFYNKIPKKLNSFFIEPKLYDNDSPNPEFMVLYRSFTAIGDHSPSAIISFTVNTSQTSKMFGNILKTPGEHIIYTDSTGSLFYTDDMNVYKALQSSQYNFLRKEGKSGQFDFNFGKNKYLAIYDVSANQKYKLIRLIPYSSISGSARTASTVSLLVGLFLLLISIVLITLISRAITRPIERLSKQMEVFGEGNFDVKIKVDGNDEIARLQQQFNDMAKNTKSLIDERYRLKLAEKSAVLKALEAEVNPHFLYNALQTISTMALKSSAFEVSDMIGSLALSMRYCISGIEIVSINDEIRHIENYLAIQKARFGNRLNVVYDIDENTRNSHIPKLAIQTLVENSIKHALEKKATGITIKIKTRAEDESTIVTVSDNGIGMTKERFAEVINLLNSQSEAGGKSIGLKNLNSRLRLNFGIQSRLYIATSGSGTRVFFAVPL